MSTIKEQLEAKGIEIPLSARGNGQSDDPPTATPLVPVNEPTKSDPTPTTATEPLPRRFGFKAPPTIKTVEMRAGSTEERAAALSQINQFKEEAISKIPDMVSRWFGLQRELAETPDDITTEEISSAMKAEIRDLNEAFLEFRSYEGSYRFLALLAFASALVKNAKTTDEAGSIGRMLFDARLFKESASGGSVRILGKDGKTVILADEFSQNREAQKVFSDYKGLLEWTRKAERVEARTELQALNESVPKPLTHDQLAAGCTGSLVLEIPARTVAIRGEARFLHGGHARFDCANGRISLGGVASFSPKFKEIGEDLVNSHTTVRSELIFAGKVDLGRIPETTFARIMRLREWVETGIRTARDREEKKIVAETRRAAMEAERVGFKSRGRVTLQQFFLDGQTGSCFIEDGDIFFVVKRDKKTGQISLTGIPTHLKDQFGGFKEPRDPGEKFSGIESPLGNILRTCWSRAKAERTRETKALETKPREAATDEEPDSSQS